MIIIQKNARPASENQIFYFSRVCCRISMNLLHVRCQIRNYSRDSILSYSTSSILLALLLCRKMIVPRVITLFSLFVVFGSDHTFFLLTRYSVTYYSIPIVVILIINGLKTKLFCRASSALVFHAAPPTFLGLSFHLLQSDGWRPIFIQGVFNGSFRRKISCLSW